MGALDPRLQNLLAIRAHDAARIRAGEVRADEVAQAPAVVGVLVKFTGEGDDLSEAGLNVGSLIGGRGAPFSIATGTIALDAVEALAAIPHVSKVEMGRELTEELDVSAVEIRARPVHTGPTPLTGRGVVVGIIDSGIDWRHHAFRFASGGSRILFLWDQTETVRARRPDDPFQEAPPPEYPGLGIEYTQAQIDLALEARHPLDVVRSMDKKKGHGTHVAGIAAGDGSQAGTGPKDDCTRAGRYVGVAPDAGIIVVKNSFETKALGRSQNLVDAIRYIFTRAASLDAGAGRPCVINISQGDNLGPHDGTSLVEQAIDLMLLFEPAVAGIPTGRAIVKSAGNEGVEAHHAMGTVPGGGSLSITFEVQEDDKSDRAMECWYAGAGRLDVTISTPPPGSITSAVVKPGDPSLPFVANPTAAPARQVNVTIKSELNDPENGDNSITIDVTSPVGVPLVSGTWTLEFRNTGGADIELHCWLDRGRDSPRFTSNVTSSHTISIPGTASSVITVASYAPETYTSPFGEVTQSNTLADSSSRGPTRTGQLKPDVAAPGVGITAAKSLARGGRCCDCCYTFYEDMNGTSMAAPHVAGVIALMFQKNPKLDFTMIRGSITGTARVPALPAPPALPDFEWGAGKIDALAAVDDVPEPPAGGGAGGGGGGPVPFWQPPSELLQDRMLFRRLSHMQHFILQFPEGHRWAALVSRHVDEVLRLIRESRRVAAVWHRQGGPGMLEAAIALADEPATTALPAGIDDHPLAPRLALILASWRRYGSPALVADIDRHRDEILTLPGRSLRDVLATQDTAA